MKTFRKIWKGFWEPVLGTGLAQWVVVIVMAILIWFVFVTCKKRVDGLEVFKKYSKKPVVFVFWHGRSMMLSTFVKIYGVRGYAVASKHKDGQMMAKLQRFFGLKSILGSSTKGGVSVLKKGVKALRSGNNAICISPDGPSGPSLRLKDGAMYFAKMTGAPIVSVCFSCSKPWFQKRWDRYLIAKPFSKINFQVSEPMFVSKDANEKEFEKIRKNIESVMVKQMRDADKEFTDFIVEQDLNAVDFKNALRATKKNKKKK